MDKSMIQGIIWTPLTITLTAVIGVLTSLYALVLLFKKKDDFYSKIDYISPEPK